MNRNLINDAVMRALSKHVTYPRAAAEMVDTIATEIEALGMIPKEDDEGATYFNAWRSVLEALRANDPKIFKRTRDRTAVQQAVEAIGIIFAERDTLKARVASLEKDISKLREVNQKLGDERYALATELESARKNEQSANADVDRISVQAERYQVARNAYKWGYEYLQNRMESISRHGWAHDCDGEIQARIHNSEVPQPKPSTKKVSLPVTQSNDTPAPDSLRGDSTLSGLADVIGTVLGTFLFGKPDKEQATDDLPPNLAHFATDPEPAEQTTDDADPGMLDVLKSIADFMDKSSIDMAHVAALIVFGDVAASIVAMSDVAVETINAERRIRDNMSTLESRLVRVNDLFDSLEAHGKRMVTQSTTSGGQFILDVLKKLRPLCS